MANNRMYLQCKKPKCDGAIAIAKFYPSRGFIAGDGAGWYQQNLEFTERLNQFFEDHQHDYDVSQWGGYQYELVYEIENISQEQTNN